MRPLSTACLLAVLLAPCADAGAADPVTVYRCTDAGGHVTLGNVPCAEGSNEQVMAMQRPVDRPLPPPPAVVEPEPEPAVAAPQVVMVRTPQPMYECITPDGDRYTSDTGEGNPRWVPLWTLGYRGGFRGGPPAGGAADAFNDYYANRPLGGRVGAPTPRPSAPPAGSGRPDRPDRPSRPHRPGHGGFGGPGTWVRDTCHVLPPTEVCARLFDRREEIRQRFFNAQPTERDALRLEERGLNARLAADCGRR